MKTTKTRLVKQEKFREFGICRLTKVKNFYTYLVTLNFCHEKHEYINSNLTTVSHLMQATSTGNLMPGFTIKAC